LFDPGSDFDLELMEGGSKGGVRMCLVGENGCECRTEETIVSAGEEEGESQAALCDVVTVSAWEAFNEAVQAKTPQVVGDGARRSMTSSQWFQSLSEIAVGKAVG